MKWLINWLFPKQQVQTLGDNLHWAVRGSNDDLLHGITPLDKAWIDRHSNQ